MNPGRHGACVQGWTTLRPLQKRPEGRRESRCDRRCIAAMVRRISLGPFRADGVTVEYPF